jgi:hypothetical protein
VANVAPCSTAAKATMASYTAPPATSRRPRITGKAANVAGSSSSGDANRSVSRRTASGGASRMSPGRRVSTAYVSARAWPLSADSLPAHQRKKGLAGRVLDQPVDRGAGAAQTIRDLGQSGCDSLVIMGAHVPQSVEFCRTSGQVVDRRVRRRGHQSFVDRARERATDKGLLRASWHREVLDG